MTWRHHVTVGDRIHRLIDDDGRPCWGIDGACDADHPSAIGSATVDLPGGQAELVLVEPLPGGLVLDVIRSYGGLAEGEVRTLVVGIADELQSGDGCDGAAARLSLECFGLDGSGRPRCIPGMRSDSPHGIRAAVGEMLYHAAAGRPWSASLEPVDLAFGEFSSEFRRLVGDLLTAPDDGSSVTEVFSDVAEVLRGGAPAAPLPLLPADRDLDPGASLTARLRTPAALRTGSILAAAPAGAGIGTGQGVMSTDEAPEQAPGRRRGLASRLRESTRKPGRSTARSSQSGQRTERPGERRRSRSGWSGLGRRIGRRRLLSVLLASALVAIGTSLAALTWTPEESSAGAAARTAEPAEPVGSRPSSSTGTIDDAAAVTLLEDLSDRRAHALSTADRAALDDLTVPGSAAAAADEVLDLEEYAGKELSIALSDVSVVSSSAATIVVRATMEAGTAAGAEPSGGAGSDVPRRVEFDLRLIDSAWRVDEVREIAADQ